MQANTRVTAKMTIPSPTLMHFRFGRASISKTLYPDLNELFDDLGKAYAKAVRAFYDAGCRYLQFDDTIWAFLCSERSVRSRASAATIRMSCRRSTRK